MVNWLSGVFTYFSPEVSLSIGPLNSEARINILTAPLSDEDTQVDPALRAMAQRGAAWEPADARYVSVLGLMEETEGKTQDAQTYYQSALTLLPVEIQALSRRFIWQLENGQAEQAVDTAVTIYRRWPQYLDIVSAQLPYLLSSEDGYRKTLDVFKKLPDGPDWIVATLSDNPETFPIISRLLLDWRDENEVPLRDSVNRFIIKLLQSKNRGAAYSIFLNTLSEEEKSESGYVFNGEFNLDPNGSLFDWTLQNQSGLDLSIVDLYDNSNSGNERALQVRFLGSPVRLSKFLQLLRLPPSKYNFSIDYSTRSLRGPKPVRITIKCTRAKTHLASIELGIGGSSDQVANVDFAVPSQGCETQNINIVNDNFVESWQNRYSGSLLLKSVSVTRLQ